MFYAWNEMMWDDVRYCEMIFPHFFPRFKTETKAGSKEYRFRKAEEGRLLHLGEDGEPLDCPYPLKEGEKKYIFPQGGEVTIEVPWKITTWVCLKIVYPLNPMVNDHYPYEMAISLGIYPTFSDKPTLISWLFCWLLRCSASRLSSLKRCALDDADPCLCLANSWCDTCLHGYNLIQSYNIINIQPWYSNIFQIPLLILKGGDTFQCSPLWWILGIRISIWQVKTSEEPQEEDPCHTQSCWFCHGAPRSPRSPRWPVAGNWKCIERIPWIEMFLDIWRSENLVKDGKRTTC